MIERSDKVQMSPSVWREWIEIHSVMPVVLRQEWSPSVWREWIEISVLILG